MCLFEYFRNEPCGSPMRSAVGPYSRNLRTSKKMVFVVFGARCPVQVGFREKAKRKTQGHS